MLVLFLLFVRYLLGRRRSGGLPETGQASILLLLAATTATVKLSALAFAGTIAVVIVLLWVRDAFSSPSTSRNLLARAIVVSLVVFVPWGFKGFILSGTPLYPSLLGYGIVRVDWAVPRGHVVKTEQIIRAWARQPHQPPRRVLRNWAWLRPWAMRMKRRHQLDYSLAIAAFFLAASAWLTWARRRRGRRRSLGWLMVAPGLLALAYWFATAPAPRFATAELWCLAYGSSILFLQLIEPQLQGQRIGVALAVVFLLVNLSLLKTTAFGLGKLTDVSTSGWQPITTAKTRREVTPSGLSVLVTDKGQDCWDAPLPCAPRLNPRLRLRKPGDLASGFRVVDAQASPMPGNRSAAPGENRPAP